MPVLTDVKREWYGIPFSHPVTRWQADLIIWQRCLEPEWQAVRHLMKNPVSEHYLQANRDLFTPSQLRIHEWFEECAYTYTENRGIIFLGSASSGKSFFTGWTFLLELATSVGSLYAYMVSTDKGKLRQRSFASAIQCLACLKANRVPVPLKYVGQICAIVPENEDVSNPADIKSQLAGIAISEGSEIDAKAAAQGVHLPRVRACADEFENMGSRAKVFMDAQANLRMGAVSYKCVLLFNPQSLNSPGCQVAAPDAPGGWASLDPETAKSWNSKSGFQVLRFDGLKSPGIKDPSLTFLPTEQAIADVVKDNGGNVDAPNVWAMVRGFPRMSVEGDTVLTEAELLYHKALDDAKWRGSEQPTLIAGFDPAFTAGGDDAPVQLAEVGHLEDGTLACKFLDPIVLEIQASSSIPVVYQLVGGLKEIYQDRGFNISNLAVDDSGTQSVGDVISKEIRPGFYRSNFGTKASDLPVSIANGTPANKQWANHVTELWGSFAEYVRYGQIRRLPQKAAEQFTTRRFSPRRFPKMLESKSDYKKRTGRKSPDNADACALCIAIMRFVLNVRPGASLLEPKGPNLVVVPLNMSRIMAINNLKSTYGLPQ